MWKIFIIPQTVEVGLVAGGTVGGAIGGVAGGQVPLGATVGGVAGALGGLVEYGISQVKNKVSVSQEHRKEVSSCPWHYLMNLEQEVQ